MVRLGSPEETIDFTVCVIVCDSCSVSCSFKLDGDTRGWLQIDAATGEIKTKEKLDRETVESFEVTVTAFEKGEMMKKCIVQLFSEDTGCSFFFFDPI